MNVFDRLKELNDRRLKHSVRFSQVFHLSLGRFWHPVVGFDVVKFDDHIGVPPNESTADYVRRTYGDAALWMVKDLLGVKE